MKRSMIIGAAIAGIAAIGIAAPTAALAATNPVNNTIKQSSLAGGANSTIDLSFTANPGQAFDSLAIVPSAGYTVSQAAIANTCAVTGTTPDASKCPANTQMLGSGSNLTVTVFGVPVTQSVSAYMINDSALPNDNIALYIPGVMGLPNTTVVGHLDTATAQISFSGIQAALPSQLKGLVITSGNFNIAGENGVAPVVNPAGGAGTFTVNDSWTANGSGGPAGNQTQGNIVPTQG